MFFFSFPGYLRYCAFATTSSLTRILKAFELKRWRAYIDILRINLFAVNNNNSFVLLVCCKRYIIIIMPGEFRIGAS